jgi:hypothetical protein
MAQIYVPIISPFSVIGPLHDADDSHIQSHHVAYEIAALSHSLNALVAEYDLLVDKVTAIQVRASISKAKTMPQQLKKAERTLLSSHLPHEIKMLRARIKSLNEDLMVLTRP